MSSLGLTAARRVTAAAAEGQRAGVVRNDVSAQSIATLLIAITVGVEGMIELEVDLSPPALSAAVRRLLRPVEGA